MALRPVARRAAALGFVALLILCASCTKPKVSKVKPFVRGYLAVRVDTSPGREPGRLGQRDVFLPGVKVHLLKLSDNSKSDPVTTDLSGRFTLPASDGKFRVCWEADGFDPACTNDVTVAGAPMNLSTVRIGVRKNEGATSVFGSVRLSDGTSFRLLEPLADVNVFGRVFLLDATRTKKYEALVNNFGDYFIPQVPIKAHVFLEAHAEAGEGIQEVRPEANLAGARFHGIDLAIRNTPPRVEALVARHASGERVQVASAGETLTVKATAVDPEGDAVSFQWLADTGPGSLSSSTGPQVDWKLPSTEALYSLTLIASDGKGGHVRQSLPVRVDAQGVIFSGRVVSTAGGVIAGAQAAVNGKTATTDATGFFRLHVPPAKRYVLNVDKPGFSLLSRVFDHGVIGGIYKLRPATVATADPTLDIDVQDKRSGRDCPGPASMRFNTKDFPGGVRPVWQDGKGNVIAPRKDAVLSLDKYRRQECGPGVRVRIPANSLVDGGGNAPAGPIQVALSTVDLMSPDQMPGDYTVALPTGGTRVMESYGAATVEVTSGGAPFNLKPGASAEIVLPVDPAQLAAGAALPATIPILFYDRSQGTWKEEATATLQGTTYVAKVKHFSAINTDLVKTNQSCVRVDASHPGLPGSFRMQVIIPLGTAAPRVLDVAIDNSLQKEHVVYNLPSNTNITLAPYDATTTVPFGTFVVNTGGAQNPTSPNLPFGPPYVACSTLVVLNPQVVPEDPISGEFLHGLFSFAATKMVETDIPTTGTLSNQLNQATTNYYSRVDPNNSRQTLGGFKTVHGFTGAGGAACATPPAGETCAIYANSGDLGFGREMHCKKNGANVACYVTNYGSIATDDDDDVAAAAAASGKVATVAMEYAPIENDPVADAVVKFFVYNAADNRVNFADLDGKGIRPVPQLCMVCHGGSYPGGATTGVPPFNTVDEAKLGSEFLAFDLHNYTFAAAPFDKASQQAAFKVLNEQIVLGTAAGPHTQLHVAEMYDGDNGVPATTQEELPVISDPSAGATDRWTAQPSGQETYKHVVGNACRTCHATNPAPSLHFVNAKQVIDILGSVEFRVCSQHVMPHAKRTHDLFWLSTDRPDTSIVDPHQPGILEAFGTAFGNSSNGWQGNLCGVFTAGGVTPPSVFTDIQNQVFTPQCSGCHLGSSPAGNLNLSAASSYAQIVNVASCVRPAMKRIQPGSPSDSFLFRKIQGSHTGLSGCNVASCNPFSGCTGGCGSQMPYSSSCVSSSPVSAAQQTLIQNWINAGAPN